MSARKESVMPDHGALNDAALDQIFCEARTHSYWLDQPVGEDLLRRLYDLIKWGPTSANSNPLRVRFLRTPEAKQRLVPALAPANVNKVLSAPVTAIIGYDLQFYEKMPMLFPHAPGYRDTFANAPALAQMTALRNSSLQGAYLIVAARALGLDCGPLSGFDNAKVDTEFFAGTHIKSNFLCNLGYGDASKLHVRGPRLSFDEAAMIL